MSSSALLFPHAFPVEPNITRHEATYSLWRLMDRCSVWLDYNHRLEFLRLMPLEPSLPSFRWLRSRVPMSPWRTFLPSGRARARAREREGSRTSSLSRSQARFPVAR